MHSWIGHLRWRWRTNARRVNRPVSNESAAKELSKSNSDDEERMRDRACWHRISDRQRGLVLNCIFVELQFAWYFIWSLTFSRGIEMRGRSFIGQESLDVSEVCTCAIWHRVIDTRRTSSLIGASNSTCLRNRLHTFYTRFTRATVDAF